MYVNHVVFGRTEGTQTGTIPGQRIRARFKTGSPVLEPESAKTYPLFGVGVLEAADRTVSIKQALVDEGVVQPATGVPSLASVSA